MKRLETLSCKASLCLNKERGIFPKNQTLITVPNQKDNGDQNNNFFNTPDDSISFFWNNSPSFV